MCMYKHTHIHTTEWNIILPLKENFAICDNIDRSRKHYVKCIKLEKDKDCMISLIYVNQTNKTKWKQTHRYREQMSGCQKGGR